MVHRYRLGDQSDKNISSGQNVGLQEVSGDQGDDRYRLQKRVGGVSPLLFGTYGEFFRDKDGSYASLYRVARLILPSALYYTWNAFLDFQCNDLPPSVTLKQVAEHTNKNLRTIELNVQRLRQLGYLYTRHAPRDGMYVVEKCFDGLYKAVVEYLEWERSASYIPPLREFFAIDQLDSSLCNQLLRFNNYRRLIRNKKPGPKPKKVYAEEEECANAVFRGIAEAVISPADSLSLTCTSSLSLPTPEKEVQPLEEENKQDEDEQGNAIEKVMQRQEVCSVEVSSTQDNVFVEDNGLGETKEPCASEVQPLEPIDLKKLPGLYMSVELVKGSPEGEVQVEEEPVSGAQEQPMPEPIDWWETLADIYAKLLKVTPEGVVQLREDRALDKQDELALEKKEARKAEMGEVPVPEKEEAPEAKVEEEPEPEMQDGPVFEVEEEPEPQVEEEPEPEIQESPVFEVKEEPEPQVEEPEMQESPVSGMEDVAEEQQISPENSDRHEAEEEPPVPPENSDRHVAEEQQLPPENCSRRDLSACPEQGTGAISLQEPMPTISSLQSSSLGFQPNIQLSLYRTSKSIWIQQGVAPYYTDFEWERLKEISATRNSLALEWNKCYDLRDEYLDAIEIIDRNSRAYINTAEIMLATKPWLPKRLRELNAERDLYLLKIRKAEDDADKLLVESRALKEEARALIRIGGRRQFQHAARHYKKQGYSDFVYRKISWKARATGLFLPGRFVRNKPISWNMAEWGVVEGDIDLEEEGWSEEQPQDTPEYIQPSQAESQQDYGYVEGQVCFMEGDFEYVEGSIVEGSIEECVEGQVCSSIEGDQGYVEGSSIEGDHKEPPHVQIKNVIVRTAHQVVSSLPVGVHIQLEQLVVEKQVLPENEAVAQQALPETPILANGHISEIPKKEPEGQQKDIPEQSLPREASDPSEQKRGRRDRRRGAQKEGKQVPEDRQGEVGGTPEKQTEQGAANGVQGVYTVAEGGGLKGFLFDVTSPEAWIKVWKDHPEMAAKMQDAVHTAHAVKLGADDAERQKKGEPLLNCSEIGQSLVREAYIHAHPSEPLPPKVVPVDQGKKMKEDARTIEYIDNYMRQKEKEKEQAQQQQRHLKRQDDLAREEEQTSKEKQAQPDMPRSSYTSPLPPGVRDLGGGMIAIPFKSRDDMVVMREDITLEDFFFQFAGGRQPRKPVSAIRDPRFKHEDDIPHNTGPISIAFKEHYMAQQAKRIEEAKNAEKIYYDASRDPYSAFYKGEKSEQQEHKQWHMGDGFVSRGFLELRKKMEKERENGRE